MLTLFAWRSGVAHQVEVYWYERLFLWFPVCYYWLGHHWLDYTGMYANILDVCLLSTICLAPIIGLAVILYDKLRTR